jgi:hypothetical protein
VRDEDVEALHPSRHPTRGRARDLGHVEPLLHADLVAAREVRLVGGPVPLRELRVGAEPTVISRIVPFASRVPTAEQARGQVR